VTTAIYKEPVQGRVALRTLNFDGGRQAELRVNDGASKAVYCHPVAHYEYWKAELPGGGCRSTASARTSRLSLVEDLVHIGDRFAVGSAEAMVTQPRLPCYKLGLRFESDEMVKRFLASRSTGFYLTVTRESHVRTGDEMVMSRSEPLCSLPWITRLYATKKIQPR